MRISQEMDLYEKLQILSDAAKYDVACTSSGVDRRGSGKGMGNCTAAGICHSFSADGRFYLQMNVCLTAATASIVPPMIQCGRLLLLKKYVP